MRGIGAAQFGALIAGLRRRRVRIGAGLPWIDPETPGDELPQYVEMHPEALQNPSMPPKELEHWSLFWPEYVENNPVLVLLSLEDPKLYNEIVHFLTQGWASTEQQEKLSTLNQRRRGMQFVKRLLPDWKKSTASTLSKTNQALFSKALEEAYRVLLGKTDRTAYNKLLGAVQILLNKIEDTQKGPGPIVEHDIWFVIHALRALNFAIAGMQPVATITLSNYAADEVRSALFQLALDEEKTAVESWGASHKEAEYQAKEVRRVFYEEETYKEVIRQLGNTFREAFYGSELPANKKKSSKDYLKEYEARQAEEKFIEKNKRLGKEIARKIAATRGAGWAPWLLLGIVAGSIAIVIAGEALAAASAVAIAEEVAAYATAADVSMVSVEQLLTAAEMADVESTLFFNALKEKLAERGLQVVKLAADAVVKVTR